MRVDEVIALGDDGRDDFVWVQNEIGRRNQLDPGDPDYLDPDEVSPNPTDAWIEPLPWEPDPDLLAQGILVYQMADRFALDPRCHLYEDPELAAYFSPLDPVCTDDVGTPLPGEVYNDPTDATNPLNVFRSGSGESCIAGLGEGVFDGGCTELEKVLSNLERLTIAMDIIGHDRVPDPFESLEEFLKMTDDDPNNDASADPLSGPDGIFAANYASGLGNLADPNRFEVDAEFGDEVDIQAIRLLDPFAETIDLQDPNRRKAFMASNGVAEECEEGAVCFAILGIDEERVRIGGFENPKTPEEISLAAVLPAAMPIQGNAVDPATGGRAWYVDPNSGQELIGLDDPRIPSHVNFIKLYYQDPVLAMRLLDRNDPGDDPNGTFVMTDDYFRLEIDGEMYWVQLAASVAPETFCGPEEGSPSRSCQDLDRDDQCDWDQDQDRVYDGIDDYTRGPGADDALYCGSGLWGDILQNARQLELARPSDQAAFWQMFPQGIHPRSPVFCKTSAKLLGLTGESSPGRRDFIWHGGRRADDTDADGWPNHLDNCEYAQNPTQEDTGGIANDPPDGIGTACQCGDVTGDGKVNSADATMIIRKALGVTAPHFNLPCNCDVTGEGTCDSADAMAIVREALDLSAPAFGNSCGNYTGSCECDAAGNCLP
jgi:hypothetical protein